MRRVLRAARPCGLVAAMICVSTLPLEGQDFENAIFHHSLVEVDGSRASGLTVGRWEGAGWIGTDFDRIWWSTEGERAGGALGDAEALLVYGHYARRFWDVVVGVRQDFEPTSQTYLGFGIMGLAPYWFEVSLLGFVSQRGKPSVRLEAENDLYLTQRLVLQPSVEFDWLLTADDRLDYAAGVSSVELGLRTRYEIRRKFAPYLDMTWVRETDPRIPISGDIELAGLRLGAGIRLIY